MGLGGAASMDIWGPMEAGRSILDLISTTSPWESRPGDTPEGTEFHSIHNSAMTACVRKSLALIIPSGAPHN